MTFGTGSSFAWINPDDLKRWQGLGVEFSETYDGSQGTSVIYASNPSGLPRPKFEMCQSLQDPVCVKARNIEIFQHFRMCESDQIWCIESIWAEDENGKKVEGKLQNYMPRTGDADYPADEYFGLPASSGSGMILSFPEFPHIRGSNYALLVTNHYQFFNTNYQTQKSVFGKFELGDLITQIVPVDIVKENQYSRWRTERNEKGGGTNNRTTSDGRNCFLFDQGECAAENPFPKNIKFGISLRIGSDVAGWFHGRLVDPKVSLSSNSRFTRLEVSGQPVVVPGIKVAVPWSEIPQATIDSVSKGETTYGTSGVTKSGQEFGVISLPAAMPAAVDLYRAFLPITKDKSTFEQSVWSFYTMRPWDTKAQDQVEKCSTSSNSLIGMVTTNSMIYDPGPPSFDSINGSLNYKVTSPHFDSEGDVATGNYDLLMRADVARCIYKFSNAPIKGTVEITSDDGNNKIATTSVNENNGWLHMSANNFTFSSPTIKVKLSQDAPAKVTNQSGAVAPTPIQPTTVEKSKTLSKTITCIKGKNAKKVSGVNPKCPTGYKLK